MSDKVKLNVTLFESGFYIVNVKHSNGKNYQRKIVVE